MLRFCKFIPDSEDLFTKFSKKNEKLVVIFGRRWVALGASVNTEINHSFFIPTFPQETFERTAQHVGEFCSLHTKVQPSQIKCVYTLITPPDP